MPTSPETIATGSGVRRVRHPMKLRVIEVAHSALVTPELLCVSFTGADLHDFVSASFDDHVKLFFPLPGSTDPLLPSAPPGTAGMPADAPWPVARDYTPRRFDPAAGTLDIEFVLHGHGPAASWAAQAVRGQRLGLGGPRGSFILPDDLDWQQLIGDDAALPAIARRLEELPAGAQVQVLLETRNASTEPPLPTRADARITWLHRQAADPGRGSLLTRAAQTLERPDGEGFVWAAGEASDIAALRRELVARWGLANHQIRAASYWKLGSVSHHEVIGA